MRPIRISLVFLGSLKYPVSIAQLESWPSKVFKLHHSASVGHLPNSEGPDWEYTDEQLLHVIANDVEADFTMGLINAPLEDNYYIRRLSDRVGVLSLHEMADIARYSNFAVEQYILRNIYEMAVLFSANGKLIPDDYESWAHDETRGCLFDMNANKTDIVFSLHRPVLCPACRTRVSSRQVPAALLPALDAELTRIQKTLFVRMSDWVRSHPIWALAITAASGLLLNLLASFIFEQAKKVLPWLG